MSASSSSTPYSPYLFLCTSRCVLCFTAHHHRQPELTPECLTDAADLVGPGHALGLATNFLPACCSSFFSGETRSRATQLWLVRTGRRRRRQPPHTITIIAATVWLRRRATCSACYCCVLLLLLGCRRRSKAYGSKLSCSTSLSLYLTSFSL